MVDPRELLGGGREAIAKKVLESVTPSELPIANALVTAIVTIENQQAQAVEELRQAADLDVEHGHDPEDRRELLLEAADAVAEDCFTEWYLGRLLDVDEEDLQELVAYADLEPEEWEQQKREWFRRYRDKGVVEADDVDDVDQERIDGLADQHVRHVFDLELETFRSAVVEHDRADAAESVLAGPIVHHTRIIAESAEVLESAQERVEKLESRVDELEEDLEE